MDYESKPFGYYDNIQYEMLKYLPQTTRKEIEVRCGDGSFAKVVKEKAQGEGWGVGPMPKEAAKAEKLFHKVFTGPSGKHLDSLLDNYFDVAFFNDVLEHPQFATVAKLKEQ